MKKDLNEYTLSEFQEIENYNEHGMFDSIVLVPMEELHDSGYRCMKGILVFHGEIIGSVGGWCDVVNPNGIGNYGRYDFGYASRVATQLVENMGLSIDCLVKSNCIRLMLHGLWQIDDFIGSNLCFYKVKNNKE